MLKWLAAKLTHVAAKLNYPMLTVTLSGSIIENSIQESVDHMYCHVGRLVTKFGMI